MLSPLLSEEEIFARLSRAGLRITQARRAITRVILEAEHALTPAQTYELARRYWPRVGLVTAYRTLELLAQFGLVRRIHSEDGCSGYARVSLGHRHDLVCRQCGRVVEFGGCDLAELLDRVQKETGFTVSTHTLELAGTCPRCQGTADTGGTP
jgi:Fur family transcriptional regulator, ferric uptake regulator